MKNRTLTFIILTLSIFAFSQCKKENCEEKNPNANCICTEEYAPVCGCNNKTYGNSCEAVCYGIEDYSIGACN